MITITATVTLFPGDHGRAFLLGIALDAADAAVFETSRMRIG